MEASRFIPPACGIVPLRQRTKSREQPLILPSLVRHELLLV
ncbi:hypothetical protein [Curtobacterium sp. 1310]|nr:hypothetical protein [Curtobacterium sp. 1310]MBP1300783.1 hypothetical protein [Curtobacterium sp. 1310]